MILVVFLGEAGLIFAHKQVLKAEELPIVPFKKSNSFDVIIISLKLMRVLTVFAKESIFVARLAGKGNFMLMKYHPILSEIRAIVDVETKINADRNLE